MAVKEYNDAPMAGASAVPTASFHGRLRHKASELKRPTAKA